MTKSFLINAVIAILVAMFYSGCETNLGTYGDPNAPVIADQQPAQQPTTPTKTPTPTTPTNPGTSLPPATSNGKDQLNISSVTLLGPHKDLSRRARVTRTLYSANKEGGNVRLSFPALNFPQSNGLDGGVYIFWQSNGRVLGGFFDHHRVGQTSKTLSNVSGGYLSGLQPAPGDPIWFCLASYDGDLRTTVTKSKSNW